MAETSDYLEESDGAGGTIGLEVDKPEDQIDVPFDPKLIDVTTERKTVDLILKRLRAGELDLSPDFQRRGNLWKETVKSSLIESMLLRIPIPSLYVSEDEDGNYEVVDGLQRLCAIAHFVDVASLNKAVKSSLDPLRLTGLTALKDLSDCSFPELKRPFQRRIEETELTLHVIRSGTPRSVKFNIFSRINRGGLPLKSQEIRNAIYPGKWINIVRELAESESFRHATGGKIKGLRLEDHELVLRFIGHYLLFSAGEERDLEQNLDVFLNNLVEEKLFTLDDDEWSELVDRFHHAMVRCQEFFEGLAFRKYSGPGEPRKPINKGLFEAESVVMGMLSEQQYRDALKRREEIMDRFGEVSNDEDSNFHYSMYSATGRGWSSNMRINTLLKLFRDQ